MNKLLFILLLNSLSFSVFAVDNYTVDPRHTFPSFEIWHLGFSIQRGRFNHTTGNIMLDTTAVTGGRINIA